MQRMAKWLHRRTAASANSAKRISKPRNRALLPEPRCSDKTNSSMRDSGATGDLRIDNGVAFGKIAEPLRLVLYADTATKIPASKNTPLRRRDTLPARLRRSSSSCGFRAGSLGACNLNYYQRPNRLLEANRSRRSFPCKEKAGLLP
jgi:hypothetical protein